MKTVTTTLTVESLLSDPLQYKKVLENNSIAFILGCDGNTLLYNKAASDLFGYTWQEFLGIHRDELFLQDDRYREALKKRAEGQSNLGELTGVRKDGTFFPCEVFSRMFLDLDGVYKSSTTIIDISAQKELIKQAKLTELILNNIEETFVLVDKNYNVINYTNAAKRATQKIFNYTLESGKTILDMVPPERRENLKSYFEKAFAGETPIYFTNYIIDGEQVFYRNKFKPIYSEQLEIFAVLLSSTEITEQVRTEEAMEQTEQRWRFALEGSLQGVWDWDIPSGKCYFSPTWKQLLGYEERDLFVHINDWKKILHPEDVATMEDEIGKHFQGNSPYHETVHRLRTKKGDFKWILARGMIISYDEKGAPKRMIGTHTDITHQRSIQQGYQQLFYNHPLPMWIYEKDTLQIVEVNEAALKAYGYSRNEFLELSIEDIRPKEDIRILHEYISSIKSNETAKYIVRHYKKDGELIYVQVIGNDIEYNDRNCRMISADNITAKIKAENELRKSNERFELAGKATSDAIWDWDIANHKIHWGKSLQTLFGYEQHLTIEMWTSLIHEDDRKRIEASLDQALTAGSKKHWTEEYRFKDARGHYRYVLDRGFIVRDEQHKPFRMIGAMQDISERKRKERELEQSNERFEMASLATSDIVWDWNIGQDFIELANKYSKTFGIDLPLNKRIGTEEFRQRVHKDDQIRLKNSRIAALNNIKTSRIDEEFRYQRQDGTYAFVLNKGYIIRNEQGKAVRIIGAMSDISEKKYQQELLALELRVFETSAIPHIRFINVLKTFLQGFDYIHTDFHSMLLLNDDKKTIVSNVPLGAYEEELNSCIRKTAQRSQGSILNKKHVIVTDLENEEWADCFSFFCDHNWKLSWIIPILHADGKELGYFSLFLTRSQSPSEGQLNSLIRLRNLLRILMVNYQSLNQVRSTNERYNMVMQATHDMIWDWNLESGHFYRNEEGLKKVYGISDNKVIQNFHKWLERIHPEDYQRVERVINNILHSTDLDKFEVEYRFKRDDGMYSFVYDRGIIIKDASGKPLRLIGAAQDVSERKKLEEELVKNELERQRAINQASIDTQEKERREIGKELHDNVNQILTTTKLYLDLSLSNTDMKDDLIKKSSSNINYVINEIRQLSRSLMDPSIGDLGLIDSLHDLIESINITKKLSVSLKADYSMDDSIAANQKLTVFRIIQEALSNTIKHAQATKASITIGINKENIELVITDNGQGFDMAIVKKGAGLKNIYNRVYLMNGKHFIKTSPGNGCIINIQFPINQSN